MGRKITGDEFYEILKKIVEERVTISELLSDMEIYEILSEKHNNEVLDAWNEGTFDLNDKLYSFTIKEQDGEREYSHGCLVEAKSFKEAQKKADEYCKSWYPDDPTFNRNDAEKVYYFNNGCVFMAIIDLAETSRADWSEQAYTNALISREKYGAK